METDRAVLAELARLRSRLPDLSATVIAGVDGMLLAYDAPGLQPETIAALAAANLGLTQRFAQTVGHGDLRETMIESSGGYVAIYAAGVRTLLAVLARPSANVARIHHEARRTARRLGELLDPVETRPPAQTAQVIPVEGQVPLAKRTPMAALQSSVPGQRAG
ncbi:roadblock/LC7 domain-containing protein [Catenuloplanes atrovinosus]|uniref:Regulator of Ras-like GTPase activity (Roadblock/LC7/MglB family) n=1 Tax=Catenuloplanes atrovinosus TaxID=137266 RepID=A0AAE3YTW6_9ACTN|nr:roadblock/LC7 domain-containing protein [Catenuloplanes atrovinosus]MDR7278552.1 putative regulator of Ras-like GTPase activity (Roadblock/LC7/MglB family) [Catenuloplanes atrovinosus]